jgi:hypothetical protein
VTPGKCPIARITASNSGFDALVGRDLGVALDHRPLDFDGAVHRIDDAAELNDAAVAGALDDAAVMHGDGRINEVAPKGPEPCEDAIFVRASKPGIADDVGHQDRGEFPCLAHGVIAEVARSPGRGGLSMARVHAALAEGMKAGSASLRVDPSVYPRRLKHNTVAVGEIADGPGATIRARSVTRVRQPPT